METSITYRTRSGWVIIVTIETEVADMVKSDIERRGGKILKVEVQ